MQRWQKIVGLMAVVAVLASVGASAQAASATAKADPVKVGIIYSRTGALAAYGAEYIQGLRYGLAYATKGTNAVNGQKIELTIVDDAGDPVKAVSAAKDLIGKGYKIIGGSVSSGVALQLAPLAAQNKVLYISGPGRDGRRHRGSTSTRSGRVARATRTCSPRARTSAAAAART